MEAKADKPKTIPKNAAGALPIRSEAIESKEVQKLERGFRFLDLPAELRCLVYEELLVVGKVYFKTTGDQSLSKRRTTRFEDKDSFRKPYLAILRTCKMVHEEAEKTYLSMNLFVLPPQWQMHALFTCRPHEFNNRHLFSPRGLEYVRNLSIAMDQEELLDNKDSLVDVWHWGHLPTFDYDSMTEEERLEFVHDHIIDEMWRNWELPTADALREMRYESSNWSMKSIEIDWTNAYCHQGCCRPLYIFNIGWLFYLQPARIINIGTRSQGENENILREIHQEIRFKEEFSWIDNPDAEDLDLSKFDIQFPTTDSTSYWDRWSCETNQRG